MTLAFTDVRAVLPDRVVDGATVVIDDGLIVEIRESGPPDPAAIDGRGAFLLPGLVDTHSDGLEREVSPRANVRLPMSFALRSFEGRLRAAGITTVFHGVAFEDGAHYGRSVELAEESCAVIAEAADGLVDHRILYRLDARSDAGLDSLVSCLPSEGAPLVSLEDHTPGQGQFRDLARYAEAVAAREAMPAAAEADQLVRERIAERDELLTHVARNRSALAELAVSGRITLLAHDPEGTDDIDEAWRRGAAVAEFPVSVEAARAAHRRHMNVVMGAPNVLRGGSHSGNVSAEPLVASRLCDVLASDYLPSSLLAAVFGLVERGAATVPDAVALVTSKPAAMSGLPDRGRLAVGLRADVVLVDVHRGWPRVLGTWRAGDPVRVPAR